MAAVFIRTILTYLLLIGAMRLSGKRQIGELQLSELVTAFLLSEIASHPLTNADIPFLYSVVPVAVIISLEIILSFLSTKSAVMKGLLEGKPGMIIRRGVIDQKEMGRLRFSMDELLSELHLKNIATPEDVEYAILEQNGKLSVFPKESAAPATLSDLHLSGSGRGIAHVLVIDGHIQKNGLAGAGKSEDFVNTQLQKRHIRDIKEVFLMTVDDAGTVSITRKEG